MHIVIVGVGKIGSIICKELADEHDVVVIEQNADKLESFINTTDVTGIAASGVDVDALQSADTAHADVFIAVTAQDEINIISCIFAKQMGAKYTIARIREHEYTAHQSFIKESIGIDAIINPERESARQITSLLRFPATTRVESFVRGRINIVEYPLPQDHPFVGQTLAEFQNQFKEHVLVVIVERNGQAIIPKGNFRLQAGDIIHVSGSSAEILNFFLRDGKGKRNRRVKSLMIIGAGRLTHYLLREIEQGSTKYHIKVLENNRKTAELLAQLHPNVEFVFADGSNYRSLEEEGISGYDCLIALTGIDEENILFSFFAASQTVPTVISKVNRTEFAQLAAKLGLDCIVSPKKAMSNMLVRYARALENTSGSNVETLYKLMDSSAEAAEFIAHEGSRGIGIALRDLRLRRGVLVAGIIRDRRPIIPTGDDMILDGDRVVVIASGMCLRDLSDIFER